MGLNVETIYNYLKNLNFYLLSDDTITMTVAHFGIMSNHALEMYEHYVHKLSICGNFHICSAI